MYEVMQKMIIWFQIVETSCDLARGQLTPKAIPRSCPVPGMTWFLIIISDLHLLYFIRYVQVQLIETWNLGSLVC